jgi:hypothetical protein
MEGGSGGKEWNLEAMAESGKHGDRRFRVNARKKGATLLPPPKSNNQAVAHESGNPHGALSSAGPISGRRNAGR